MHMKHAILILAHKNVPQLVHLIEYFKRNCYVFVHIDKKSKITEDEIKTLEAMPQVRNNKILTSILADSINIRVRAALSPTMTFVRS